jgi:hypothetical protein
MRVGVLVKYIISHRRAACRQWSHPVFTACPASAATATVSMQVPRLSNPAFLLEVEAVAVLPPKA